MFVRALALSLYSDFFLVDSIIAFHTRSCHNNALAVINAQSLVVAPRSHIIHSQIKSACAPRLVILFFASVIRRILPTHQPKRIAIPLLLATPFSAVQLRGAQSRGGNNVHARMS
ncbi:hypothetical protein B0H11DRAFT_37006 [Mycena galericulata]|nr:hypothetical protein B0H11DRAFT_37006 [Mycena galericulata]